MIVPVCCRDTAVGLHYAGAWRTWVGLISGSTRDRAQLAAQRTVAGRPEAQAATALTYSEPVRVAIPRIDVDAQIQSVGVEEDGSVEVPSVDEPTLAGWYRYGPSPGEEGSAVILGPRHYARARRVLRARCPHAGVTRSK